MPCFMGFPLSLFKFFLYIWLCVRLCNIIMLLLWPEFSRKKKKFEMIQVKLNVCWIYWMLKCCTQSSDHFWALLHLAGHTLIWCFLYNLFCNLTDVPVQAQTWLWPSGLVGALLIVSCCLEELSKYWFPNLFCDGPMLLLGI